VKTLRIATRRSKLAVRQTEIVAEALRRRHRDVAVEAGHPVVQRAAAILRFSLWKISICILSF